MEFEFDDAEKKNRFNRKETLGNGAFFEFFHCPNIPDVREFDVVATSTRSIRTLSSLQSCQRNMAMQRLASSPPWESSRTIC
jgi:hypothetical protein